MAAVSELVEVYVLATETRRLDRHSSFVSYAEVRPDVDLELNCALVRDKQADADLSCAHLLQRTHRMSPST